MAVITNTPAEGYTVSLVEGTVVHRGQTVPSFAVVTSGPDGIIRALTVHGLRDRDEARATANSMWTRVYDGERVRGASCHPDRTATRRNPYDLAFSLCAKCEDAQADMEAALDI